MYQQVTLVGNLGRDPEMRYTPSGVPITVFSVAVSKSWTSQDGQRNDKTTWFRITTWRSLAETCSKYLTKGQRVLIVGEIEDPYVYTDQSGSPKASLQVTAQTVRFLNSRNETDTSVNSVSAGSNGDMGDVSNEEDIPF